jgi:hypothetical protein
MITERRQWSLRRRPLEVFVSDASPSGGPRNLELLAVYCNDHLAASIGGIELVKRMLGEHRATDYDGPLTQLLDELRDENASLEAQMRAMGFPIRQYKQLALWVGEKLSRVKLNGRLLSRSPLSDLIEFEFLASAVRGKRSGFETLREVAEVDHRLDKAELDRLIQQANRQYDWLSHTRREVAATVFGGRPQPADDVANS